MADAARRSAESRLHDSQTHSHRKLNMAFGKRGYLWVTLALFAITIVGHWVFAWFAYAQEQAAHGEEPDVNGYLIETSRDTLENWQSEFLQLAWQVAGLALLWYVGSPQSREGDERKEQLLEHILKKVDPQDGERIIKELEHKYPKS